MLGPAWGRVAKSPILREIWLCAALVLVALPAFGSSVDVRCRRLTQKARGELQARARLLLLGAGMDGAEVAIDCDTATSWLVWVDGVKTTLDETSGLVEGALDAIENRIAQRRKAIAPAPASAHAPLVPTTRPKVARSLSPMSSESSAPSSDDVGAPEEAPEKRSSARDLEGGVGLATATEFWPGAVLMGPRLDVGLSLGKRLAFVIGEGARFGLGAGDHGQVMIFDLQAGVAFGAPYHSRTALGVVLLAGAERLAVSNSGSGDGAWGWTASLSLGLRASVALGDVDLWIGADGIARARTIETGGPSGIAIPQVSGLLSIGGFLPAFAKPAPPPPPIPDTSLAKLTE